MLTERSDAELALVEQAHALLPAGGLGNIASDMIIARGQGGRVWDTSGREYVDLLLGSGPMLLGHAHPEVTQAVLDQVQLGTTFFVNNEPIIRLAAEIVEAVACADRVRFVSSGTEADLYAMRLARAVRRRDKILKFEGGYHGMSDYGLMSLWPLRPGNFPQAAPDSAGIPTSIRDDILVSPYNDLTTAQELIRAQHDDIAGVIVEPMQRLIPPSPGFLHGLREITREYSIPLIFDEVVTGFRLAYGGAQSYYGVVPDICTLGKVIGGGFPLAAIAGRDDIMAHLDRARVDATDFLPQIGTLSGNPVAAVAGLATLAVLRGPGVYERIFSNGNAIRKGLIDALSEAGVDATVSGEPPMFDAIFRSGPVRNYRDSINGDVSLSKRFNAMVRDQGVLKSDNKIYVSFAHDQADIDHVIAVFHTAARAL